MGNKLGNVMGTHLELDENTLGTRENEKKKILLPHLSPHPNPKGKKNRGILRCYWEHIREHIENLMGEHIGNRKN
jgi:hypothetical protein